MHRNTKIWIGTSGWHYDHWRGPFYPSDMRADSMLAFYAERFPTVEINNSFYRLPSRETFAAWRRGSPKGFLFAVKGSRFITHMKKLKDPGPSSNKFFAQVTALEEKLGPILFQFHPRWRFNRERLAGFLETLPRAHRYAFELRDPDWWREEVYDLLHRRNVAVCLFHLAGVESPPVVTADFVYVRLHGPGAKYQGRYSEAALETWAGEALRWQAEGRDVYVYFDNDQAGYAAVDARRLTDLVRRGAGAAASGPVSGGRKALTRTGSR
jgi:uncharacterized protein YecE (DUF72 family)